MQYNTIITPAVQFGTDLEIPIGTLGDSVHIKLSPRFDTALYFDEVETSIPKTPKKHVRLNYFKKNVVATATEGESIQVGVTLSEPSVGETKVTLEILHTADNLDDSWRRSRVVSNMVDVPNDHFFSATSPTDFNITSTLNTVYSQAGELFMQAGNPQATAIPTTGVEVEVSPLEIIIPHGQTTGYTTLTSVDDGVLTGGKGFFKACEVHIKDVDGGYMVHHTLSKGYALFEDSSEYPVWTGAEFELWGKNIDKNTGLLDPEPIVKDDTTVVLKLGYTTEDDGVTPKDSLARTFIVDYTPLDKIYIRCKTDSVITALDGTDISTLLPFYCAVVIVGENR